MELWAAIEKPAGRIVDFLLDHGVVVYPVNPKALDRVRDRFRMSQSKSDSFDAYVLAEFVRTDHGHLRALEPSSEQAQELKMLTRDHHRLVRHKTRIHNLLDRRSKSIIHGPWRFLLIWNRRSRWIFSPSIRPARRCRTLTVENGTALPSAITISVRRAVKSCGRN